MTHTRAFIIALEALLVHIALFQIPATYHRSSTQGFSYQAYRDNGKEGGNHCGFLSCRYAPLAILREQFVSWLQTEIIPRQENAIEITSQKTLADENAMILSKNDYSSYTIYHYKYNW
ncbi:hypothetical protein [Aeromonas salmonicida]|uniref:hypothetical protein n=1 Tax=Aeromonas salmonicida TaxID=645 RepID=UPI0011124000|nr:hypothetical protein [Aeromonas salmonicida]